MAQAARHGRTGPRGPWARVLSVLVILALVPLGALPAAAGSGPATGVQRAQVEVGEDDDEETPEAEEDGEPEVIADDFEDEDEGVFATERGPSDLVRYAYEDGEYVIETLDPDAGVWQVQLNGPYADVEIAVDARIAGRTTGRFVKIGCRFTRTRDGFEEYSFVVDPSARRALLYRSDGDEVVVLAAPEGFAAVNPDRASNRLELSCIGETIAAAVNGEEVAEVEDDAYAEGAIYVGAGTYSDVRGTVEARFDNLEVTVLDGAGGGNRDDRGDDEAGDDVLVVEDFAGEEGGPVRAGEGGLARYPYDDGELAME